MLGRGRWIFVTLDHLRHTRRVGESDEKPTCMFTSQATKKKKKIFERRFQFHPFPLQLQLLI